MLESRARAGGYRRMLRTLIDEVGLRPDERILEVGSGSGAVARWLASDTERRNPIVGVDINRYLLREATALAANDGLAGTVTFQEGGASALPFADATFDVAMSITVIEETDADRLIAEMVRVTRSGGRVAVIARSMDLPFIMNLTLDPDLKAKVESPGAIGSVVPQGCADASLYQRFQRAGLTRLAMYPIAAVFDTSEPEWLRFMDDAIAARLSPDELARWRSGRGQAEADGTFFMAFPHHCAVGTKP
jgi:ubiquinone/menaquinone biosynthesis C-methylase UbiE